MSNWDAGSLCVDQIKYAAVDVLAVFHTYRQLLSWQQAPQQAPICPVCSRRLGSVRPPALAHPVGPTRSQPHSATLVLQ